tara:strand:- start:770 stop:925 length:156 start_codon:yes stop_codon:yes gene_type:complete
MGPPFLPGGEKLFCFTAVSNLALQWGRPFYRAESLINKTTGQLALSDEVVS